MKIKVLVSLLIISCSFGILGFKNQKKENQKTFVDTKNGDALSATNKNFEEVKLSKDKMYNPSNIKLRMYALLLASIGAIGLFFSFVMNTRKKRDPLSSLIIGAFIVLYSFCVFLLSFYVLSPTRDRAIYLSIVFMLTLLKGPILYFYFRKTFYVQYVKRKDILHIIPFLFSLSCVFFFSDHLSLLFIGGISLVVYILLAYFIYDQKKGKVKKTEQSIVFWHRNLLAVQLIYTICFLIYGVLVFLEILGEAPMYFLLVPQCFMVLYISYISYMKPEILNKRSLFEERTFKKYRKSGLTKDYSEELKKQLQKLFTVDKIYRDGNLTLEDVSNKLSTSRHNVSQVINEHFEVNFFQFVNKYRIGEVVEILKKSKYKEHKMMNIAFDVGFNNKVTFNRAFKAEMNMTPTVFLKMINDKEEK